jgi:phage/plasmid-like protein (TIGR03299 family)
VPAWHGLGAVIPGGTDSIDDVLDLARIGFRVDKVPVRYTYNGKDRIAQDRWVTVRADTGDALGVVGRAYEVFQQRQVFEFLQDLVERYDVVWESAGALRGGRKVFVTMRMPQNIVIDRGGLDDEIVLYVAAVNSHDGASSAESVVTPWRIVCGNTERFAVRDAVHRWGIHHTKRGLSSLAEARLTLGLTREYAREFEAEENQLVRTGFLIDDFHQLVDHLWKPDEDAGDQAVRFAARRHDELDAMFRAQSETAGRSAYAAERTVTDYLDHKLKVVPRSLTEELAHAQRSLEGAYDDLKTKAHRQLLLTRR